MRVYNLRINGIKNPLGYQYEGIACSWKVDQSKSKVLSKAKIEVAGDLEFTDILLTLEEERLDNRETCLDLELKPYTTYYWRVFVTGDSGDSAVSETAVFETGKMKDAWQAKWIGAKEEDTFHPEFKTELCLKKAITRARMYICGLGMYETYLNGKKVGREFLSPNLNDYAKHYEYQTYDVTAMLQEQNEWNILLGKGWYMSLFGLDHEENNFGQHMKVLAELRVEYEDGTCEVIGTDENFFYRKSDIVDSGIYYGEDISRVLDSDKTTWKKAVVYESEEKLTARYSLPIVVKEKLHPVEIIHTPAGETVVDFGQNHAGFMEFHARFTAGTKISITCGEVLQQGNFYHENYRTARTMFTYVSDGREEIVRPHFTYFGYRYLKVEGWPGELKKEDITANVIYSDLDRTGYIETSNEKINRLYQNCLWSQKSNFIDLPTDCPQRDERLGWTGDAQVFSQTASYNMDTRAFFHKFLQDVRSEQVRAGGAVANYLPTFGKGGMGIANVWGDIATLTPMVLYHTYGNKEEARALYPLMRDWVLYLMKKDEEKGNHHLNVVDFQFGDWLGLDGITEQSMKGGTEDDYIGAMYYYQSAKVTAEMAEILHNYQDAEILRNIQLKIRNAILEEYFSPKGRLVLNTQAAYILSLKFEVYRNRDVIIRDFLVQLHKDCYEIKCGFVGAPLLCTTLCECGLSDLAFEFLMEENFPSWLYCVNLGATTIWERWNSLLEDGTVSGTGMNSFNHYSYGSVVEFFYTHIAGIQVKEAGYKKVTIAPNLNMKFRWFTCKYESAAGTYQSNWKILEDGKVQITVEIPFDAHATLILPRYPQNETVELDAGSYEFTYMPTEDYRLIYSSSTRLGQLAKDEEAMAILKEKLPVCYYMVLSNDKEGMNLSMEGFKEMAFLGFTSEMVDEVIREISVLKRW